MTSALYTRAGAPEPGFGVTDLTVPSSLYSTSYSEGTYTPGIWAHMRRYSLRGLPDSFHLIKVSIVSCVDFSPSPSTNMSKKSASGSGLNAHGPPAITNGPSVRSALLSGMPDISSASSMLV